MKLLHVVVFALATLSAAHAANPALAAASDGRYLPTARQGVMSVGGGSEDVSTGYILQTNVNQKTDHGKQGKQGESCYKEQFNPFKKWCVPPTVRNSCPVQEGIQDLICSIKNVDGSTSDMCYRPGEHVCTPQHQLCPVSAPYSCGQACYPAEEYSCDADPTDIFKAQLKQRGNYDKTKTCFVYSPLQHFFTHHIYQAVATSYNPQTQDCVSSCHIPLPFPNTLPLVNNVIVPKSKAACGDKVYNPATQVCQADTSIDDPWCLFAKVVPK